MTTPEFVRQEDEPIYPKVLFNRPITRAGAGRMLLVGGHSGEFSLPTNIYTLAIAAGIGECRVVLPDVLAKFMGGAPGTSFAPSSTSGSLGREGLAQILELSEEADALVLGASLSNNSNTSILIERVISEVKRPIIVFDEALSAVQHNVKSVTDNPHALVILTMAEVFKLCGKLGIPINIRPGGGLINKLEIIQDLHSASACDYAVYGTEIIVAAGKELVVTPINYRLALIPALYYAVLATFWIQNPTSRHDGLVAGSYVIRQASKNLGSTNRPTALEMAKSIGAVLKREEW